MNNLNWIIFALAIVGVVLNIRKKRACFLFWLVTNGYWAVYNYAAGELAEAATFAVFWVLSIYGFKSWGKPATKKIQAEIEQLCRDIYEKQEIIEAQHRTIIKQNEDSDLDKKGILLQNKD